ncbi:ATP-binding protein [Streptomyces sp. NPDC006355]|uniref:ATP-binding protein n=1 Tax=Streptomyces sp. NPDC006355 TaxID=3156758 RepID=UPI0033A85378
MPAGTRTRRGRPQDHLSARPTARAVRYELFTAPDLAGEPPRPPSEFDRLLKTALAERPRTFLVDEAQWLNGQAFEYVRYLWDEPSTQLAIIFVGGKGCHTVLRREPMLSSGIFIWQHFTRLTPSEVLDAIPLFHPIWANADPDDITFADQHAPHGNVRAFAQLTAHTHTAMARTGRPRVEQELLRWAFSRLASPPHRHAARRASAACHRGPRPGRRRNPHAHRSCRPPSAVRPDHPAPRPGHHQRDRPGP